MRGHYKYEFVISNSSTVWSARECFFKVILIILSPSQWIVLQRYTNQSAWRSLKDLFKVLVLVNTV